jgi:hypothetical protein
MNLSKRYITINRFYFFYYHPIFIGTIYQSLRRLCGSSFPFVMGAVNWNFTVGLGKDGDNCLWNGFMKVRDWMGSMSKKRIE